MDGKPIIIGALYWPNGRVQYGSSLLAPNWRTLSLNSLISTWSHKEIVAFHSWYCNNQIYTLSNQSGWRIVDHIFPPEALALMYTWSHDKSGHAGCRNDVHTLTIPCVVKYLHECAPDDSVTGDYNNKNEFCWQSDQ